MYVASPPAYDLKSQSTWSEYIKANTCYANLTIVDNLSLNNLY